MSFADLKRKLTKQVSTGRRHFLATRWVLYDMAALLRWRLVWVGFLGLAAVGCKFLAVGLLYLFVDALAQQDGASVQVPLLGTSLDLREFFVVGVILGTCLLMLATGTQFSVRRTAAFCAAMFEERCVRRALAASSHLPNPAIQLDGEMFQRQKLMRILAGARSCNVIARQSVQLMPSIIGMVSALVILTVIDPVLTAMLVIAFLGVVVLQYPMTNRSVRASDVSETDRQAAMSDVRGFVQRLGGMPVAIGREHPALQRLFHRRGALQQDIRTFTRQIDGMLMGYLTARMGSHLILAGLFIFVGMQILSGARDWASFAAYVAIARSSMKDFQTSGKILGQIGRLFMPVERYRQFIESVKHAPPLERPSETVTLSVRDDQGHLVDLTLHPQRKYLAVVPPDAGGDFAEVYVRTTRFLPPATIDDCLLDVQETVRSNLALADDLPAAKLESFIEPFVPEGEPIAWPAQWLDSPAGDLPILQPWLVTALKVAAAHEHQRPGVIISAPLFRQLPRAWETACLQQLRYGPLIVSGASLQQFVGSQNTLMLIAESGTFAYWVEREHAKSILEKMAANSRSQTADAEGQSDLMM